MKTWHALWYLTKAVFSMKLIIVLHTYIDNQISNSKAAFKMNETVNWKTEHKKLVWSSWLCHPPLPKLPESGLCVWSQTSPFKAHNGLTILSAERGSGIILNSFKSFLGSGTVENFFCYIQSYSPQEEFHKNGIPEKKLPLVENCFSYTLSMFNTPSTLH